MISNQSNSLVQFEVVVDNENHCFILEPLKGKLPIINLFINRDFNFKGMIKAGQK